MYKSLYLDTGIVTDDTGALAGKVDVYSDSIPRDDIDAPPGLESSLAARGAFSFGISGVMLHSGGAFDRLLGQSTAPGSAAGKSRPKKPLPLAVVGFNRRGQLVPLGNEAPGPESTDLDLFHISRGGHIEVARRQPWPNDATELECFRVGRSGDLELVKPPTLDEPDAVDPL